MPGNIARHLAATRGVADVHRVLEVKRLDEPDDVSGVGIHVVSAHRLGRATVATTVMGNYTVALVRKNIIWASQSSADSGHP
jgi:hypothetical protein